MNLITALPYLTALLVAFGTLGALAFFAFRQGFTKQAGELQLQAISAQDAQIKAQETQILAYEKEIARLRYERRATRALLKPHKLHIEIDGDVIMLVDEQARLTRTTQIRMDDKDPAQDDIETGT